MPPALTKDQLQQLVRLQEEDKALDTIQAAIDKVPGDIKARRDAMESEKAHLTEIKTKANKLLLAKKEKETQVAQKEEAVRKHGTELNSVKTNDAYRALQTEIDQAKAAISNLETEILTMMDEIDQVGKEEKAEIAKLKEVEAVSQKDIQALEARKADLETKLAAEKAKREQSAAGLPAEVMKLYDYLRKRKNGIAVSMLNGTICNECHMTVLAQSIVELAKGKLVTCESCQRILYNNAAPAEKQPPQQQPA